MTMGMLMTSGVLIVTMGMLFMSIAIGDADFNQGDADGLQISRIL